MFRNGPDDRRADIVTRPGSSPILTRIAALGGAALLTATAGACQLVRDAQAGMQVSDAVDELMAWEALTVVATVDATRQQVADYLERAADTAPDGAAAASNEDLARMLANLELTVVAGDPEYERRMRDTDADDPLNTAMTLNFGGRDITGLKLLGDRTYARVGGQAIVTDVYGGDAAALARAQRFEEDASRLPGSLRAAADALRGEWVEVEPYRYQDYADALTEHGGAGPEAAAGIAEALTDVGTMLDPEVLRDFMGRAEDTLRSSATLRESGEERGARVVTVTLPAGEAYFAFQPLFELITRQCQNFGLPPLVTEPADPDQRVTAELAIRNGVLSGVTFDLGQFGGQDAGTLPLRLDLAGGAALNLDPPSSPAAPLSPEDLTVALLYLAEQEESRTEDQERAEVPGPMQP